MGLGGRWLRGGLALAIGLAVAIPASAAPGVGGTVPSSPGKQGATTSAIQHGRRVAKVDPGLDAALAKGGLQTFLVKLNGQADVTGVAKAEQALAQKAGKTPAATRLAQSTAVVNSLRQTAEAGQSRLIPLVDSLQKNGDVSSYEQFFIVNALAVTGDSKALQALAERPEVASISPSQTYHLLGGPSKSGTGGGTPANSGEATGGGAINSIEWNIAKVNAPQAWALGIDGTGIIVANLDTGVDGNHPALARKWRGADGSDPIYSWFDAVNNANSFPYDDHNHGTHTMGTIAGSDASGENQIGVAPGARWIAAKILDAGGSGTDVDILEAAQWILAPGGDPAMAPDVVSNSWGGGPGLDEWLRPAVQAWRAAGIVPAFASGNDGPGDGTVSEPGNYPESIAVGATDINDNLAGFSSRGPSPYGETKPEVSAPGVGVRSSVPGGGYQGGWSGTSMATPHVAGVAALLRQANASLSVDEIEQLLTSTASPRTDSQYTTVPNNGYGWGIVNAFDAISAVLTGRGTLKGRVVISGDDLEPPVITHSAVTQAYAGFDIPITATVTDNISLTEVNIYARTAGYPYYTVIPMEQTSGDLRGGTYEGVIPGYLAQIPAMDYYIRAVDFGNNPVSTAVFSVEVLRGLTPGWSTDLETQPVGWNHAGDNDSWQWGQPTSGPGSAHSGSNLWATNLSGNYANGTNAYLMMPPLDLTGVPSAMLTFWHWYDLEAYYDYAEVYASVDYGATWAMVGQFNGPGTNWQQVRLDLTPFAGQTVALAFNLYSDGSVNKAGWYIDDLALIGPDNVPPESPTGLQGSADNMGAVTLTWNANAELDLGGYVIYRSATSGAGYVEVGQTHTTGFVDNNPPQDVASYYVVAAFDMWGNVSGYSSEIAVTPHGPATLFFDDMENGENGWTHGGLADPWQRGVPTSGPNVAFSGANVWATNLSGNYATNTNAWLMSPPINLTGVTSAAVQFAHWYQFESDYDFGYLEATGDGGATWVALTDRISGGSPGWLQQIADLSAFAGQTVQIRFRMTSDSSVNKAGWYIDDVKVLGVQAQPASVKLPAFTKQAEKRTVFGPTYKPAQPGAYREEKPGTGGIGINALPMDATVTILETGRSVRTNPSNGFYSLTHAAGAYSARAESYGYYPATAKVEIPRDGTMTQNFLLQPIPKGTVTGVITNARTGEPIMNARVEQLEDLHVGPAFTGADGSYQLTLLVGSYKLRVSAEGFKPYTVPITVEEGSITVDAALEPFIGFPGELAYDDGTGENAYAFYDAGNGWAVRMTPDPAKGSAMLKSGSFYLWDSTWPNPGGDAFAVSVYDASGPDGSPGVRLAGPINVTGTRGTWNTVDLSSLGLQVSGDFYMTYIQAGAYPNVPGLGVDESGTFADRSWQLVGGQWAKTPQSEGNRMIRATVLYEVAPPVITSPKDGMVTNLAEVPVQGKSIDGALVTIFNDGVEAGSATVAGGQFTIPVALHQGANSLTATARVAAGETRPSAPVNVILDTVPPVLTVDSPADGLLTNREVATVTGAVSDEHMGSITVNGEAATLTGDAYSRKVILDEGANTITVVATDLAGNSTTITRQVTLDTTLPVLTDAMPNTDVTITTGQSLGISVHAEPGLPQVGYRIFLATSSGSNSATGTAVPNMTETAPGLYQGTYTAPTGTTFSGASIDIWANDAAGNFAEILAPGRLTVTGGTSNQAPTSRITLPSLPRVNKTLTFSGTRSSDPDGQIVSYQWTFVEENQTAEGAKVNFNYSSKGLHTIQLTVTDNMGATNTATATIMVR